MPLPKKSDVIQAPGIIVPAPGMGLRCRNGHVNSWDVRVIVNSAGNKAKVAAVRCTVCGTTVRLDNKSFLQGSGKRTDQIKGTPLKIKPGEEYNGRSER